MEMHGSLRGDKHELYCVVIKSKNVRSCPSTSLILLHSYMTA